MKSLQEQIDAGEVTIAADPENPGTVVVTRKRFDPETGEPRDEPAKTVHTESSIKVERKAVAKRVERLDKHKVNHERWLEVLDRVDAELKKAKAGKGEADASTPPKK